MLFSASTGGFYSREIHGDAVPDDAVPITDARHRQLLALQSAGAVITARDDGMPQARRACATLTERRTQAVTAVKAEAERRILQIAPLWRQINDVADVHLMSAEQLAERDARQAMIRQIRAASDLLELPIATATAAELRARHRRRSELAARGLTFTVARYQVRECPSLVVSGRSGNRCPPRFHASA